MKLVVLQHLKPDRPKGNPFSVKIDMAHNFIQSTIQTLQTRALVFTKGYQTISRVRQIEYKTATDPMRHNAHLSNSTRKLANMKIENTQTVELIQIEFH